MRIVPALLTDTGAVCLFARKEGGADQWGQMALITATDSITYDQFGNAVAACPTGLTGKIRLSWSQAKGRQPQNRPLAAEAGP